jgi:hypothetical protein
MFARSPCPYSCFGGITHVKPSGVILLHLVRKRDGTPVYDVTVRYAGLQRYTGMGSPASVSKALKEAQAIGWLQEPQAKRNHGPGQRAGHSVLTPYSDELRELANATAAEVPEEIAAQKELRQAKRNQRINEWQEKARAAKGGITTGPDHGGNHHTGRVSRRRNWRERRGHES